MEHVLVVNKTDIDQIVINIPSNTSITLSPRSGTVIDTYNKNHSYLYKSYSRKGLSVRIVDDSYLNKVDLEVNLSKEEEPLPILSEDNVNEEKTFDEKPKRRSRKSNKNDSSNIENDNLTSESGE